MGQVWRHGARLCSKMRKLQCCTPRAGLLSSCGRHSMAAHHCWPGPPADEVGGSSSAPCPLSLARRSLRSSVSLARCCSTSSTCVRFSAGVRLPASSCWDRRAVAPPPKYLDAHAAQVGPCRCGINHHKGRELQAERRWNARGWAGQAAGTTPNRSDAAWAGKLGSVNNTSTSLTMWPRGTRLGRAVASARTAKQCRRATAAPCRGAGRSIRRRTTLPVRARV